MVRTPSTTADTSSFTASSAAVGAPKGISREASSVAKRKMQSPSEDDGNKVKKKYDWKKYKKMCSDDGCTTSALSGQQVCMERRKTPSDIEAQNGGVCIKHGANVKTVQQCRVQEFKGGSFFKMLSIQNIILFSSIPLASAANVETWRVDIGYPEGIVYDTAKKRVLLSSLTSPVIAAFDPMNEMEHVATFHRSDADDGQSCFGLAMDPTTSDRVWCAAGNLGTFDAGKVAGYDLNISSSTATEAGDVTQLFPCMNGTIGCGMGNDVVFDDENKNGFVTDTGLGKVYQFTSNTSGFNLVAENALLQSTDPPFGANGIVPLPNTQLLIVSNYGLGTLNRVEIETGNVTNVGNVDFKGLNPDGLVLFENGRLGVVTSTTLFILTSSDEWETADIGKEIDIDYTAEGEVATTATIGSSQLEMYITYIRISEILGNTTNKEPSLVARVDLDAKNSSSTVVDSDSSGTTRAASLVTASLFLTAVLQNF